MLATILYGIFFVFIAVSTFFSLIPYRVLRLFRKKDSAHRYIVSLSAKYGRCMMKVAGIKVEVRGIDNIPDAKNICLIANHQSYSDVALLRGYIPVFATFVSKKELFRVPFLGGWLRALNAIPLDRKSPKSAIKAISDGVETIKNGQPVMIFPEGTRSRKAEMGEFKRGSLKLATRSSSVILPVTIDGAYKLYEERNRISPGEHVVLTVHPPVDTSQLSPEEKEGLAKRLWEIINSALKKD